MALPLKRRVAPARTETAAASPIAPTAACFWLSKTPALTLTAPVWELDVVEPVMNVPSPVFVITPVPAIRLSILAVTPLATSIVDPAAAMVRVLAVIVGVPV